jgi:dTMP kinase
MRPNISNCHALPGTLIILEGPDGSGKSTQLAILKNLLEKEGKKVTVSSWKDCPIIGEFLRENESLKKMDERILPETNLFLQAADLLYRVEREIIPALKKGHVVILDRGLQTLIVRGLMIGMSETQIRK